MLGFFIYFNMVNKMITNLISFLYGINVEMVRKSNNGYIFYYNKHFYIFQKCYESEEKIRYIYNQFFNSDNLYHIIVKNKHNKYVSNYNNENYILMMIKFTLNRRLLFEDINYSTNNYVSHIKKTNFNWTRLWKQKIDQVEFFVKDGSIYFDILTLSIINYYLMLSEIAIIFYDYIDIEDYIPLSLCHNRIKKEADLYDYFSVTNLLLDHKTRDLGEYIKNYVYSNKNININDFLIINQLSLNEKYMLVSRILFPSYFFDIFDDFIINNRDFNSFYKNFIDVEIYNNNLKTIINFIIK